MSFAPLSIQGCWLFEPTRYIDSRGFFQESFKHSELLTATGFDFSVKQVNQSVSSAGVVRGIHWADDPPGQAKYVSVSRGKVIDYIVDLRPNSSTFRQWQAVPLSFESGNSVVIANGIGHAFLSLEENTVVTYLCSEEYNPSNERTINPLDRDIAIPFKEHALAAGIDSLILSPKDQHAPAFSELMELGILGAKGLNS